MADNCMNSVAEPKKKYRPLGEARRKSGVVKVTDRRQMRTTEEQVHLLNNTCFCMKMCEYDLMRIIYDLNC